MTKGGHWPVDNVLPSSIVPNETVVDRPCVRQPVTVTVVTKLLIETGRHLYLGLGFLALQFLFQRFLVILLVLELLLLFNSLALIHHCCTIIISAIFNHNIQPPRYRNNR